MLRQPGARARTRSDRSACRCPTSRCGSSTPKTRRSEHAGRRGRRADPARAAAHAGVLEQPARDSRRRCAPHDDGGPWLHTGDLAYMDEDGYVFLVDRKKDMIKTSGFQVWPREIEEVICRASRGARGRRRRRARCRQGRSGEGVGRAQGRTDSATEDELRAYCRERLAPYKVPAQRRVPDGAAEDDGGKGAAARARGGNQ